MAMTADSSANHLSPVHKKLPSPWAQVVRGDLEAPSASDQPPSPVRKTSTPVDIETPGSPVSTPLALEEKGQHAREGSDRNQGNAASAASKKPVWNKPSSTGTTAEAAVMGDAIAWPALSEVIRSSPKVQSADPPAPVPNADFQSQPAVGNSTQKPALDTNHVSPSFSQYHRASARQKPTKHIANNSNEGGNNDSNSKINSGFVQNNFTSPTLPFMAPPPPPPFPILVGPNGYGNYMPPTVDSSVNQTYKVNNWEVRPGFMYQPPVMGNHHSNPSRIGNFGSHPLSDGQSYRGGYGGRHDQDRGNYYRDYRGNRDANITQRTSHRGGFVRTPSSNVVPFFPPFGVQHFGPRPFSDFYYPGMHMETYRAGGPFISSAAPVIVPVAEYPSVPLLNQINYYFSDDNLVKDEHLKKHMDAEGWVHISLIANFPRVKRLTTDEKLILQTMRSSSIVEVQGDKLRRRNDWKKWLLVRLPDQFSSESGSPSSIGSTHTLSSTLQKITLDKTPISEPTIELENNI